MTGLRSLRALARKHRAALEQLTHIYGNHNADDADVVVALGGDGLMLQTLHAHMRSDKPIYACIAAPSAS